MVLVAAAAVLQGCSMLGGGLPPESPAQAQERLGREETIRAEVEARMAAEPSIGAGRIRAVVNGGDVLLPGAAPGFGALQCALANAELVAGVRLVVDFMVLEPGPRTVTCLAPRVFAGTAQP
jgi:osmotically-inducible protein OsmY